MRAPRIASTVKELKYMNRNKGWTIIQTMLAVLVAGIVVAFVSDYLIEKRCAEDPAREMCARR